MQTSVTFKNLKSSDHLKDYVGTKLNRFDKYLDNPAEANVVLSMEKFRHIVDVTIIGDRLNIKGREESEDDMYASIDMVLDKLEKQIKKNKEKTREHRSGNRGRGKEKAVFPEAVAEPVMSESPSVEVMNIEYKPMFEEEALMQMDLIDDHFLVFTNAKTDRVNVIYRKKDGNYGLIQPRN